MRFRIVILLMSAILAFACHPGPQFVRKSELRTPADTQAILHSFYREEDPWKVMPSYGPCWVEQVDGQSYTRQQLAESGNVIILTPGVHWVVFRSTTPGGPDFSAAVELRFEAGRQYALGSSPTCSAFGKRVVKRSMFAVATDLESKQPAVTQLEGICSRSGMACREDGDCDDDLGCVVTGKTGFGLCGFRKMP